MPELCCAGRRWQVAAASNLLDALIQGGVPVPSGCRAGSCHACLVRCLEGEPPAGMTLLGTQQVRLQVMRLALKTA
ncbi:2Fe-2S iron-sulfur cluster-binding protein, partial [Stutzerimonas stutzeri]|uniref:2Fe-2S iron-sulfur cluster-binding protein n=1 Tax=Stutzerimonas stutzeri TaxID=316 RepID=UPI0024B6710B